MLEIEEVGAESFFSPSKFYLLFTTTQLTTVNACTPTGIHVYTCTCLHIVDKIFDLDLKK